ncbi:hypothetical protein D0O09_23450 [Pseudomonas putida]|nr:hypothetical protein D0O09_23450 [Pseudomonas putida]
MCIEKDLCIALRAKGAAVQPFRDTRPLLQKIAFPCRSGLASRKGRKAPPAISQAKKSPGRCRGRKGSRMNQLANRLSNTWQALPSERLRVPQGCRHTWVLMPI